MEEKEKTTIQTTRFGEVEVSADRVINFPEGLIGFEPIKEYVMLDNPGGGPFKWLQSTQVPGLAFVICDPVVFKPDYKVAVRREDLASIKIERVDDGIVTVIVVIPKNGTFEEMTANLKGPIVINMHEKLAKQLVLAGESYSLKHRVFPESGTPRGGKESA